MVVESGMRRVAQPRFLRILKAQVCGLLGHKMSAEEGWMFGVDGQFYAEYRACSLCGMVQLFSKMPPRTDDPNISKVLDLPGQ